MKRIAAVIIIIALLFAGCTVKKEPTIKVQEKNESHVQGKNEPQETVFSYGIWLSYNEINQMLLNENGFESEFSSLVENLKLMKIDNLYVHIRSHCDSLFKSEYFPQNPNAAEYDYDIFEFILDECHKNGIKVHAWINPYRVSTKTDDVNTLPQDSPAYKWRNDEDPANDKNVLTYGGIYLNPAEFAVRQLVLNGIKEVIEKYPVDGIHFDDYFYPTTDPEFDRESYEEYVKSATHPLPLDEWRRANVDVLISDSQTAVKTHDKKMIFSVSPAASIEKNHDVFFADVESWIEKGSVDVIIPQLYFGFEYKDSEFCFDNLLEKWLKLCKKNENVKVFIGLAAYKIGTQSANDGTEWQEYDDIISRQTEICLENTQIDGVVYFSYTGLFSDELQNTKERENLAVSLKLK
jgi:uncharacterized lipoprotein YddW (UPF0748 family)